MHGDVENLRRSAAGDHTPRPDPRRGGDKESYYIEALARGAGIILLQTGTKKSQNTHLQQGLARGVPTRSRQLIEPRGAVGEAADHFDLLTQ